MIFYQEKQKQCVSQYKHIINELINMLNSPKKNFLLNPSLHIDEERLIEEALTTPYEKVVNILMSVVRYLESSSDSGVELANNVKWVLQTIRTHQLYTYEGIQDNTMEYENLTHSSHEIKSFFEYLNLYSEPKSVLRRKTSRTEVMHSNFLQGFDKQVKYNEVRGENKTLTSITVTVPKIAIIEDVDEEPDESNEFSKDNFIECLKKKKIESNCSLNSSDEQPENENPIDSRFVNKTDQYCESLLKMSFNIFQFTASSGRELCLQIGAATLLFHTDLIKLIAEENLDAFLTAVNDGYSTTAFYHNSLHGIDVMQTMYAYLYLTSIGDLIHLNEMDLLSLMISALTHDIGHSGFNNNFHISTVSELAITYNDKSVLENFHASKTFKILQNHSQNILVNLKSSELKHVRKRIIETILATDMLFHSKILALMKNRLAVKGIVKGKNKEQIIDNIANLFDDQQEIINFLIHCADISHSSKVFSISQHWTKLLMEEFFMQGDYERINNIPVSFLCDRENADIPKSQIGFIKGVVIPTFDVLTDFLPELMYYNDNVRANLEEWGKIIEEEEKEKNEGNKFLKKIN